MSLAATALAFALVLPAAVHEEREILPGVPLREVLTIRATYATGDRDARLPAGFGDNERPEVYVFGHRDALVASRRADGWHVTLPATDRESLRVVAHVVRAVPLPRLFRTRWPEVPGSAMARRLVVVPRSWMEYAPEEWTCPREAPVNVACVSTARTPRALRLRVPAAPSSWGTIALAVVLPVVAMAWMVRKAGDRGERALGALGGLVAALAVALTVVGAHLASWALALLVLVTPGLVLGASATRRRASRVSGSAVLLTLPLLAVIDGRAEHVVPVAVVMAAVVLGARVADRKEGRRAGRSA